ncbi:GGDEF domain-containing protein [Aliikangiella maris]|uniref:diguanylate cyclase n=2 Tax=Aliikangiella maris TaxID=3162458 RepID=A0ABV3MN69_9GAMM
MKSNYLFNIPQLLSLFVAQSNDGYAIYDENDMMIYCNHNYAQLLFDCSPIDVQTKTFAQSIRLAHTQNQGIKINCKNVEQWILMAQNKRWQKQYRSFEIDLLDGRWLRMSEQVIGGKFLYAHITEITQNKELENELRKTKDKLFEKAYHDELTGIPNRRAFIERMNKEMNKSLRNDSPLIFFLFDIDHFKVINDKYGHLAGDSVLQSMCSLVLLQLRDYDFVARIGGEEFAIVFTDGSQQNILATIERIRILIEEAYFQYEDEVIQCTASFGGTTLHKEDKLETLMSRADINLYSAKQQGRNRIEFSE